MAKHKLGIIVGSNRRESINRKLAQALAKLGADAFDANFIRSTICRCTTRTTSTPVPAPVARFKARSRSLRRPAVRHPRAQPLDPRRAEERHRLGLAPWGKTSWPGKPAAIIGTAGGAISTAIAQQHLRAVLGSGMGMHLMGGEAYIQFKPDLIDAQGAVTDDSVRGFLKNFIDQFAAFAGRFAQPARGRGRIVIQSGAANAAELPLPWERVGVRGQVTFERL